MQLSPVSTHTYIHTLSMHVSMDYSYSKKSLDYSTDGLETGKLMCTIVWFKLKANIFLQPVLESWIISGSNGTFLIKIGSIFRWRDLSKKFSLTVKCPPCLQKILDFKFRFILECNWEHTTWLLLSICSASSNVSLLNNRPSTFC